MPVRFAWQAAADPQRQPDDRGLRDHARHVIGKAEPAIRFGHVHDEVVDVGRPHAQRIERKTPARRLPQLGRKGLHQPDCTEDFGHARQQHHGFRRWHPVRGDGEEGRGLDEVDHACREIECRQNPAQDRADHAPGSQPGSASRKPAKSNPGTTTQETRL